MKKVINGKLYDTDTAQPMGEWDNGRYGRDFGRCFETLYKKRTGEFFLHGEGGPLSKYKESCGLNESCGGEKIIPLSYEKAQQWAEEHLDGDDYIKIFGEPEEGDEKAELHVYISKATITKIKQAAGKAGVNVSEYIEKLING